MGADRDPGSEVDEAVLRRRITAAVAIGCFVIVTVLLSYGLGIVAEGVLSPWLRVLIWILGVGLFAIGTYHAYYYQLHMYSS